MTKRSIVFFRAIAVLAVGLIILNAFTGCSPGNKKTAQEDAPRISVHTGGYVEEQLAFPKGINSVDFVHAADDGMSFVFIARDAEKRISRNTFRNGAITTEYPEMLDKISQNAVIRNITGTPDGGILMIWSEGAFTEPKLSRVKADGFMEDIIIPGWGSQEPGVIRPVPSGIIALDEGFLISYMMTDEGIVQYDDSGAVLREYRAVTGNTSVAARNGILAVYDTQTREIVTFNTDTGQQLKTIDLSPYLNGEYFGAGDLAVSFLGEDILITTNDGIFAVNEDGVIQLVDGEITMLSSPSVMIQATVPLRAGAVPGYENEFYTIMRGAGGYTLTRFAYSNAYVPKERMPVLEVYSLYDNPTVRQAISVFQRENGARVEFNVAMASNLSPTTEDVIRALNARILAGNGPDIIILDGMPVDSYIEKDVLRDIVSLVQSAAQSGAISGNFSEAYAKNGGIYGIPTRFNLPVMIGNPQVLADVNSLSDLAWLVQERQTAENEFFFSPDNLHGSPSVYTNMLVPGAFDNRFHEPNLFMNLYNALADGFVTDELTVNEPELESYLSNMLSIEQVLKSLKPGSAQTRDQRLYFTGGYEHVSGGIEQIANGNVQFDTFTLIGRSGLSWIISRMSERDDIAVASMFNNNAYFPVGGLAILSSTDKPELAERFISTALTDGVQGIMLGDGFPVNPASLADMLETVTDRSQYGTPDVSDLGFAEMARTVNRPIHIDNVVKLAVANEIEGVSGGSITPAEAVGRIVSAVRLYLIE